VSFGAEHLAVGFQGALPMVPVNRRFDFNLERLDAGQMPFFDDLVGLPMKGTLEGQRSSCWQIGNGPSRMGRSKCQLAT